MQLKNRNTVIMYNPLPSSAKGHKGAPLGLLALAGLLDLDNYKVVIIDANIEDNCIDKMFRHLDDAICVGITSMTGHQIVGALEMARAVKAADPEVPVVLGGWHATALPKQTTQSEWVDIVLEGQGERSFRKLVETLKTGGSLDHVPRIYFKKNGVVKYTGLGNEFKPIEDINDSPPMPYHLLDDIEQYIFRDWYGDRILSYISSFGCPHKCSFCAEHAMSGCRWKGMSSERVVEEINGLVEKYNLDGIAFYDSNFFVYEKRTAEICRGLMKNKIRWGNANGSASILRKYSEETWDLMEASGCSEILCGTEAGDDDILKFIQKGVGAHEFVSLKEKTHRHNISLWVSLMLGIPYDLSDQKKASLREYNACTKLIQKIYSIGPEDRYAMFIYTPYPGTPLYEYSVSKGVEVPQSLEGWSKFGLNNCNIPWLTEQQFKWVDYMGNFIFANSRPIAHRFNEIKEKSRLKRLYLRISHAIVAWRMKNNFYKFPIEFEIVKFLKAILRNKSRIQYTPAVAKRPRLFKKKPVPAAEPVSVS